MEAERKACKSDCEGNSLSYVRLLQMPALRQSRSCVRSSVTIEAWKPPGKTMYFSFHLVFSLLFSNASNPHFEVFVFLYNFACYFLRSMVYKPYACKFSAPFLSTQPHFRVERPVLYKRRLSHRGYAPPARLLPQCPIKIGLCRNACAVPV